MAYKFALLDPRLIPAAAEVNEKIFASGPVLGVEVTVPTLAALCGLGNLDPQHAGGDASRAAIEEALNWRTYGPEAALPPDGAMLVTVRADLDSVGAMAVFALRRASKQGWGEDDEDELDSWSMERIRLVAEADKFARGGWPGARPFPSRDNPWPKETATAESSRPLAAIAAAVMDFRVPLADRVAAMERWLLTGEEPVSYRERVEAERAEMIRALEAGEITHRLVADGRIAVVESTHRAATMVGYSLAPVVVARNPSFKLGGGEAHVKYTVCAFEAGKFADIKSALAELATFEPGWGGSPTIGGSPQGVSSTLTVEQVVEVVARHLK